MAYFYKDKFTKAEVLNKQFIAICLTKIKT